MERPYTMRFEGAFKAFMFARGACVQRKSFSFVPSLPGLVAGPIPRFSITPLILDSDAITCPYIQTV